jgi:hypothetical protein
VHYVDEDFPPNDASIGQLEGVDLAATSWRRATDFLPGAHVIEAGIEPAVCSVYYIV